MPDGIDGLSHPRHGQLAVVVYGRLKIVIERREIESPGPARGLDGEVLIPVIEELEGVFPRSAAKHALGTQVADRGKDDTAGCPFGEL